MDFLYIISKNYQKINSSLPIHSMLNGDRSDNHGRVGLCPSEVYLLGFTSVTSSKLILDMSGTDLHLYIRCHNKENLINYLKDMNIMINEYISYDLGKLISYCVNSSITVIDSSSNENNSQETLCQISTERGQIEQPTLQDNVNRRTEIDLSHSLIISNEPIKQNTDNKLSENILEEPHRINNKIKRLDSLRSNISKANKILDSVRIRRDPVVPSIVQSERPRGKNGNIDSDIITLTDCKNWINDKLVNPKTGRRISENGPTYKRFEMMSRIYKLI